MSAERYLEHRYEGGSRIQFPLPDEGFAAKWDEWLENRPGNGFPEAVREIMTDGSVKAWLEETPAGRIPVAYMEDRRAFERLTALLSAEDDSRPLPASVNAFMVPVKLPELKGHMVICMNRAGYSALAGDDVGVPEDEWLEKSAAVRLNHECCHYFTLRVLGGMKNHALDEVVADCVGQLAAFGRYDASLQRKFFGLTEDGIKPGGRLGYYVKKLSDGAAKVVCDSVVRAIDALDRCLAANAGLTAKSGRPELIIKLATLGLPGIGELSA
jgi:hypothetical protein